MPQFIYGGSEEIVKNPEYSTCVGLLLYAQSKNNTQSKQLNEDFIFVAKKFLKKLFYNRKKSYFSIELAQKMHIIIRL